MNLGCAHTSVFVKYKRELSNWFTHPQLLLAFRHNLPISARVFTPGHSEPGERCPHTGAARWKYTYNNVVYITDETRRIEITSYPLRSNVVAHGSNARGILDIEVRSSALQ